MLSAWLARASFSRHLPAAVRTIATPRGGQCHICRRWQSHAICSTCLTVWQCAIRRCQRCAITLPAAHHDDVCSSCEDVTPEFDRAIAAVDYDGPWPELLTRLKFNGATALARPLATMLAERIHERRAQADLIVPVPLSRQRMTERGYNQSWLLAKHIERQLAVAARFDVLTRRQHTQRLMSLSAQERALQIRDAFEITSAGQALIGGRHVAIVDDVMTTGATLDACARTLLEAGARSVSAWVVARTPQPGRHANQSAQA
ncbi:MAG: ComF family protein [Aquabacterium sp.]|uniref:ComF family protein n=1 Tax=Aquabacterium sp. TaxID=1872578 RepID=UPI0025BA10DD|nr:ComF family protein [Aquabacterium sp.]MBI5925246.1 ComF family protein [Aquabacterium sp.]